jgi:hypothetical protein
MRAWWSALLLALMVSGCASDAPEGPAGLTGESAATAIDPWAGADRVEVAGFHFDGLEFDTPACSNGGASTTAPEFPRTDLVHAGTDHLEVTVSAEATMLGVQVGYRHGDAEDYTWLPVVLADTMTFTIAVSPDQWEVPGPLAGDEIPDPDEGQSWAFNHRINLPEPADQDCWTGGGTGRFDVTVEAVKGMA